MIAVATDVAALLNRPARFALLFPNTKCVIGAGLFVQSLRALSSIDPGFRAGQLLVMSVDPGSAGYDEHRRDSFWRDALDRVA